MPNKTPHHLVALDAFQSALEELRTHMVDLEAVAHAAEDALKDIPYAPARAEANAEGDDDDAPYSDSRLGMGRLQTLVTATATSARLVLQESDSLVTRLHKLVVATGAARRHGNGSSRAHQPTPATAIRSKQAAQNVLALRELA